MLINNYPYIIDIIGMIDENILVLLIFLAFYPASFILILISKLIKHLYKHIKNNYLKNIPIADNKTAEVFAFIFSYYFTDKMPLICGRGIINSLHYNIYKPTEDIEIHRVALDFDTTAHIVGISKKCDIDKTALENYLLVNYMEIVTLEGDFSNYFDIYVGKGQNGITQYVIDPAVMDYAKNNLSQDFWEISDNDLYIAHTIDHSKNENFNNKIAKFIEQIRPAFYKINKRQWSDAGETPYGDYEDKIYVCPICNKNLTKNKYWYECPDSDGIMINGKYLIKINDNEIQPSKKYTTPKPHCILNCPNCHSSLQPTNYQNGKITIDSCAKCPIRWLDSGEINKIAPIDKVNKQ